MPGVHQRVAQADGRPAHPEPAHQSLFSTHLLYLWAKGHVSAIAVQTLAYYANLDGLDHPEIAKLSSMGTFGQHPGNISRDLCHYLDTWGICAPEPTIKHIPRKDTKTGKTITEDVAFFNPAHVVWQMHESALTYFHSKLATDKVGSFWAGVHPEDPKLPRFVERNWLGKGRSEQSCAPLAAWGQS